MITVTTAGRLGNQMFIYAYALAASERLKTQFLINYEEPISRNFNVPDFFICPSYSKLMNRLLRKLFSKYYWKFPRINADSGHAPSELKKIEKNWHQYNGFMQSEEYFFEIREKIKDEFQLKKRFKKSFEKKYSTFLKSKKNVVVHCRRTDYVEFGTEELGFNLTLPFSYYEDCLNQIECLDEKNVYFVGDDLSEIREHFGERHNFHYEFNDMIVDFQLLQHADITIISNSSFAWWAAYLSIKPSTKVLAPKFWLGFKVKKEFPTSIMSVNWNWVDVRN